MFAMNPHEVREAQDQAVLLTTVTQAVVNVCKAVMFFGIGVAALCIGVATMGAH